MKVLALVPAYNEAGSIGRVVSEASRHLPVLVVDDGSRDATAEQAEAAGALAVIHQIPNQGKGAALRAGFRYALAADGGFEAGGYEAVLTLDADGQHDPADIPTFLRAWQERPADLIIGERDFSQIPPVRRLANTIGRVTFSWALGYPVRDNQSGYRLISRRLLEHLLDSQETGFEFEVEMIVIALRQGYTVSGVPIRTIYADERSHIQPLEHIRGFTRILLKTRRAMRENRQSGREPV